ncbi:hypothetical protein [Bacillus atrophaeus]|uniref:hypothetical protein n=1 Tax=Bacillus atrophaeus TaxID=1452 RepID=UPI002280ED4F|nr:hypothetical protein [Bacillus atrophaeus]MCY8466521.1 hypothetical protein [Bacillus atrophaeus]MCY8478980.1 hypothetical protein [Bacillus atrophaeus]
MKEFIQCKEEGCNVSVGGGVEYCSEHLHKRSMDYLNTYDVEAFFKSMIDGGSHHIPTTEEKPSTTKDPDKGHKMASMYQSLKTRANNTYKEMETMMSGAKQTLTKLKKPIRKAYTFVKKHAFKSCVGFVSLTLAGSFTSGIGMAILGSGSIYTTIMYVFQLIKAKRDKAQIDHLQLLNTLMIQSMAYTTVGAMSVYLLFYLSAVAASYMYLALAYGFLNIQYLIFA